MNQKDFRYIRATKQHLQYLWLQAMPWIEKTIMEEDCTFSELASIQYGLNEERFHLWAIQELKAPGKFLMFMITEAVMTAKGKILIIRWLGGKEMSRWLEDIALLEEIAQLEGYQRIEVWGRKGWEKALAPFGFQFDFAVYSKIIERGMH